MTEITFRKHPNQTPFYFSVSGHAGFARFGKDIVCSAISVLTINTINSLEAIAHQEITVTQEEKRGFISCEITGEPNESTRVLVESYVMGVKAVEQSYGTKFCRVKFEEV